MSEQNALSHPGTAAVLSFLFNGLGQLYNGQIYKGLKIIFFSFLGMLILIFGSVTIILWLLGNVVSYKMLISGFVLFSIGGIIVCILGLYSIFDAYKVAAKK